MSFRLTTVQINHSFQKQDLWPRELGNLFLFMIDCQWPCDHMIAICNILYWFLGKLAVKIANTSDKDLKSVPLCIKGFSLPFLQGGEILPCAWETVLKSGETTSKASAEPFRMLSSLAFSPPKRIMLAKEVDSGGKTTKDFEPSKLSWEWSTCKMEWVGGKVNGSDVVRRGFVSWWA